MELTIGQVIKIIIGILVFVAVVIGFAVFFRENFSSFFENVVGNEFSVFFWGLIL